MFVKLGRLSTQVPAWSKGNNRFLDWTRTPHDVIIWLIGYVQIWINIHKEK